MQTNPTYYLLLQNRALDFIHKRTADNLRYLLINLAKSSHLKIQLSGKTALFIEHHLSVYQNYSNSQPTLSAFHYTAKYQQEDKTLLIHCYFDHCGHHLLSQVRQDSSNQERPVLTGDDLELLSNIAHCYLKTYLNGFLSSLQTSTTTINNQRRQLLLSLEEESRFGVRTAKYLNLLRKTIRELEESSKLIVDTSIQLAIVERLQKQYHYLNTAIKSKHSKELISASKPEKEDEENSETDTSSSSSSIQQPNNEHILQTRLEVIEKLPFLDRYTEQQALLNKLLHTISADQFGNILSIIKKIDDLNKELSCELICLSKCGDLENLKKLLDKKQHVFNIPFLLSNAAYYKHYDMFKYIYPLNKFMNTVFVTPSMPKDLAQDKPTLLTSLLDIAVVNDDLNFFKELLTTYKVQLETGQNCLLRWFIMTNKLEFAKVYLEAGANPNGIQNPTSCYEASFDDAGKIQFTKSTAIKFNRYNPLAYAALHRKADFVKLLLHYGAKTTISTDNRFNAFTASLLSEKKPIDKEIAISIAAAGNHQVDERNIGVNATGLFYACQYGCLPSVKILLELGANPVAPHVSTIANCSTGKTVSNTPLSVAATKQHLSIIATILEYKHPLMTHKEIQHAFLMALSQKPHNRAIINLLAMHYRQLAHSEAIKQYKENNVLKTISLYEAIFKYNPPHSESHVYSYCLGSAYLKVNDYTKAEKWLQESLLIRKQLLANAPLVGQASLLALIHKVQAKINELDEAKQQGISHLEQQNGV
ncbi:MAG: hypothetical protein ACOVQX_00495 [Legionella sp.]